MKNKNEPVFLGIDTGGTYTDAVLFSPMLGVLEKAKSLTTREDLSIGISNCIRSVLEKQPERKSDITLVSISTTLATNALVEGKGVSVGLIMIGFDQSDVERAGLKDALGSDPVIFLPGGHDVHGNETTLDLSELASFVKQYSGKVSGFAVAGYFAVRNASHEIEVRKHLEDLSSLPVTCSHELSSKLGGPKRALTTLLNARLIPVIQDLILSCRKHLKTAGINAPVMVVRGDGTLVTADFALKRPIETILSGPAASLIGARYLLGTKDAVVSDIGGTTTDVAILEKGWPRIEPDGASVGGNITMVEAVAMHTFGLGGDSVVNMTDENSRKVVLGPRRQIPVSLLAELFPDIVYRELKRQEKAAIPQATYVRFAMKDEKSGERDSALKPTEKTLFQKLTAEPQPLDQLLKGASDAITLESLVSKGLAKVSGLTPSDAMHVLGKQKNWDANAARVAASICCRLRDKFGKPIALSADLLCQNIQDQLTIQSADVILKTCLSESKVAIGPASRELIDRALNRTPGFVNFSLELDRPLVGLGASAACYYPEVGNRLNTQCIVPEDADVANAIGAVTSKVRLQRSVTVMSPDGGYTFRIMLAGRPLVLTDEKEALARAAELLGEEMKELAAEAGAVEPVFETVSEVNAMEIEGSRHFVDARVIITATGNPTINT